MQFLRKTLFPLLLIVCCPPMVILMWYTNVFLGGSLTSLWDVFQKDGLFTTIWNVWHPIFFGSKAAWIMIGTFAAVQLAFMRLLPGKSVEGPLTPKGHTPVYKANGVAAFASTLFLFYLCTDIYQLFSPTIIYDHFGPLIGALNLFSLIFCLGLCIKGRIAPSGRDCGSTGNVIFDYFWGTELYPRILGFDVKMFTNCRFGMMSWGVIILSFAAKQKQLYGLSDAMLVSVLLQLLYIGKFFIWESGYMRTMDIMHDRAGYMICWGCLVWVPGIYTSASLYLVNHPNHLGTWLALTLLALGCAGILINYLADLQRQQVRLATGQCKIWGKAPKLIQARYKTEDGEAKKNYLLASGWWSLSRHFHYLPELTAALCWTLPALFNSSLPYFYFIFLTVLLLDRLFRHERRCARKYGKDWDKYCAKVPYKLIPFIF
jgi:7-dehydrocholesterol reductase